jgi:4-oxalocrotonate tautomerase
LLQGAFTASQKQTIVQRLTDAMVSIAGESMRPATRVVIDEIRSAASGIGGKPSSPAGVGALARGQAA